MAGTESQFDTESLLHWRLSQAFKKILLSEKWGRFTRRVLQDKCSRLYPKLLTHYRDGISDTGLYQFYTQNELTYNLRQFSRFIFLWAAGFLYIWKSLINRKSVSNSRIIIFESPVETLASLENFKKVMKNGVLPLISGSESSTIYCRSSVHSGIHENMVFISKVPYELCSYIQLNLVQILKFIWLQFHSLFVLFTNVVFKGTDVLNISNDFLSWPYIKLLDSEELLDAYIKTNSSYNSQQFWLEGKKNFDFYMVWYSLNTKCFQFSGKISYDNSQYDLAHFDKSITWASWHRDWLRSKFPNMGIDVAPPLVFGSGESYLVGQHPSVILFDITPRNESFLKTLFIDVQNFYYREETCIKFLSDIVDICKELNVHVFLKNKRKSEKHVAPLYMRFLQELASRKEITLTGTDADPESLIEQTDFSIAIPFTSTNYLASFLGKTSIYYDPTGSLNFDNRGDDNLIQFAGSREELKKYILEIINNKVHAL